MHLFTKRSIFFLSTRRSSIRQNGSSYLD